MEQYIKKSALVAVIEKRIDVINNRVNKIPADKVALIQLKGILSDIDSLAVQEVDLEKPFEGIKVQTSFESGDLDEIVVITKYKAQKGVDND